jgi:NAD(P)-dependent dehydrogenase (short-subunit alcohol dehydrogenase family)
VLADLFVDKAKSVAAQIDPEGQRTLAIGCDVAQAEAAAFAVKCCTDHFGGLDVLINNAGTDVTIDLEQLSIEDWDRVLATNLRGPFLLSKAALRSLREGDGGRGGHIVNAELRAQGIRVSSVIVGGMKTPFLLERFKDIDTSKLQDPANVAEAVRFVLTMPRESIIPEIMVLPLQESSWP